MADATAAIRASKRKRSQVSYLADDHFESLDAALRDQDAEKDADIESDSEERPDSNERDGSFLGHTQGKPPKKKKKTVKAVSRAKKPKPVQPFRFTDLPAELREEIYDLALTEPSGITVVSRIKDYRRIVARGTIAIEEGQTYSGKHRPATGGFWSQRVPAAPVAEYIGRRDRASLIPNLCAVSKQLREEASSILYKQEITVEDMSALHVFVTTIGSFNRQLLAHVTVRSWGFRPSTKGNNFAAFAAMTNCVNLQSLFLDCSVGHCYLSPEKLARQVYRDAHLFLEAYGSANGSFDAGVDILQLSGFHFKEKAAKGASMIFSEQKYQAFETTLRSYLQRRSRR